MSWFKKQKHATKEDLLNLLEGGNGNIAAFRLIGQIIEKDEYSLRGDQYDVLKTEISFLVQKPTSDYFRFVMTDVQLMGRGGEVNHTNEELQKYAENAFVRDQKRREAQGYEQQLSSLQEKMADADNEYVFTQAFEQSKLLKSDLDAAKRAGDVCAQAADVAYRILRERDNLKGVDVAVDLVHTAKPEEYQLNKQVEKDKIAAVTDAKNAVDDAMETEEPVSEAKIAWEEHQRQKAEAANVAKTKAESDAMPKHVDDK